jgi:hypothetical protein
LPTPGSPLTDAELDLQLLIAEASAVVRAYVTQRRADEGSPSWADEVAAWDADGSPDTVPERIRAATLHLLGDLHRFRGDDEHGVAPPLTENQLPARVRMLLDPYRDPAVS